MDMEPVKVGMVSDLPLKVDQETLDLIWDLLNLIKRVPTKPMARNSQTVE
jgi:hypothetical protein